MLKAVAACGMVIGLVLVALVALPVDLPAQEPRAGPVAPPETEEEKKARAVRRQCAAAMCAILHNGKPAEGQLTCNLEKTWRKEVVTKVLAGRPKDLEDLRGVLLEQPGLDLERVRSLLGELEAALGDDKLLQRLERMIHKATKQRGPRSP